MNRLEGLNYSVELVKHSTKWVVIAENGESTVTFHFGYNPFEVVGALEMAKMALCRKPSESLTDKDKSGFTLRPVE